MLNSNEVEHEVSPELGPLTTNSTTEAILDSGSTAGLFLGHDTQGIINIKPATNPLEVLQPDKSIITSTHTGRLNLPQLPPEATLGHLFPSLKGTALVPVGPLCDAGCTVHFTALEAQVKYKNKITWKGKRDPKPTTDCT